MEKANKLVIVAAAKAAGLPQQKIAAMLATAEDNVTPAPDQSALLLTQAQKARQMSVSRFTVRKLTALGRLHPVELLPGLLRYRADELV